MKILITGITGSGGSYLAEYLVANNLGEVYGTTRSHNPLSNRNIERVQDKVKLIHVDLSDFPSLMRVLDEVKPDIIFHIASMANVKDSFDNPSVVINNNINITLNLLEVIRLLKEKQGYNPIIQICSTSEVYGNVPKELNPITEDCPLSPVNPYAVSKLAQDSLSHVYYLSYGLNIIRTRMFSYFNAKRGNLFATNFARQIVQVIKGEKEFVEHGNLTSIRTMIDVRDAAEAYWIATTKGKIGDVYNIGGLTPISVREVLDYLINTVDVNLRDRIKVKMNKNLLRPSDISIQIPNITKFTKCTGWTPKYGLGESFQYFWQEVQYWL